MVKNNKNILVIGAGFGGIAFALRMRARGYNVTLVDRLSAIGGRAQVFNRGGFKHDAGPTVITAPFLFDELFELFDEKRENYVEFRGLDPWYRFYFHTGEQFDYRPSIEDTNKDKDDEADVDKSNSASTKTTLIPPSEDVDKWVKISFADMFA